MPRVTSVAKAQKTPGKCGRPGCGVEIAKGDSYYWFKFRYGGKHVRCGKHFPRTSELTQSDKLSTAWAAVEAIDDAVAAFGEIAVKSADDKDALKAGIETLKSDVESAKEEIEQVGQDYLDSKDNMPENFQDGDQAQDMEAKANSLEEFAQELDEALSELDELIEKIDTEIGDQKPDDVVEWLSDIQDDAASAVTNRSGNLSL